MLQPPVRVTVTVRVRVRGRDMGCCSTPVLFELRAFDPLEALAMRVSKGLSWGVDDFIAGCRC
jgi:hypothetical protein